MSDVPAAADRAEIRIVLVRAEAGSGSPLGAFRVLERLGRSTRFSVVPDASACLHHCRLRGEEIDLVVVDAELPSACEAVLAGLGEWGPPVLVAGRDLEPEAALAYLRAGAADCVSMRVGSGEALAVSALEHVRRRRERARPSEPERRLRDLERFHASVIQNLSTAVLVVDLEGRVTESNPPAEQILGERPGSLRGRAAAHWFEGEPQGEPLLWRTLRQGTRFRAAESFITRSDGSRVPVGVSCSPLFDPAGERCGAVATFQDITSIVQLHNKVLQAEKMASIGQLAAGVAHEINNPMGFIHANLFQMAEYVSDLRRVWSGVEELQKVAAQSRDPEVARVAAELGAAAEEADVGFLLSDLGQAIRESQEGSERIHHIVSDLREFSHQDTGERSPADLNQCLDSTASIVWPMMKHLVELERDYAELPAVLCYPMQLKQVFMNLLVNAYQAIEERVGDSGETGTIWLRTEWVEGGAAVTVRDTGSGIRAEHLDRIFDPFFTTKKVGSGTGLGLSTSYRIVERHGGSITATSRAGKGAAFRLWLPASANGGPPDADAGDDPAPG